MEDSANLEARQAKRQKVGAIEDGQNDDGSEVPRLPEDFPSEEYLRRGQDCITIFIDGNESPVHPTFVHQVVGRSERIVGYRNIRIEVHYTKSWRMLVKVSHDGILRGTYSEYVTEEPLRLIEESCVKPKHGKKAFTTRELEFKRWCEEDSGNALDNLRSSLLSESDERKVELFGKLGESTEGQGLLSRLQAASVWWIETSEQTDAANLNWFALLVSRKGCIVGFTSVFEFTNPFKDPDRPLCWRICQSLVLPQYQKQGHGRAMLEATYKLAYENEQVFEVNVEDPCEGFTTLRDAVEVQNCVKYSSFGVQLPNFRQGVVPAKVVDAVRRDLKISAKQVQRCYEIQRYASIVKHRKSQGPEVDHLKELRLDVKRRLYKEDVEGVQSKPRDELKQNLALLYDDLQVQYENVRTRLPASTIYLL